jgi:flagellar motor switch protein FliG
VAKDKLTGVQKSAVLFITLGPESAAPILKKLPETEIQKITFEIANMQKIKKEHSLSPLEVCWLLHKPHQYQFQMTLLRFQP